jgi:sulfate adenylyltransferase large subunit
MAAVAGSNGHAPARARTSELLRFATAGSVDDGKSTLIGRLLHDSKAIFDDQLEHVVETSARRGDGYVNLALLTDGLRAEREQGITIDVAYRYFQTPRRKFIIADTPGHEQYTRNMVTGASTADLSVVLVDARKGVSEQTRRHAYISSLLRIPHLVVCVNKMDLVGYDEAVFERIVDELTDWAARLDIWDLTFIPISALHGDNVVERSAAMPWYAGPPLLYHLEHVVIATDRNLSDLRFPVQWVIRPGDPQSAEHHDYRGYAGQVAGGVLQPGSEVVVLPSGQRSRIAAIDSFRGPVEAAFPPMAVTVRLEDELDISRGDMLVEPDDQPVAARELDAIVCWMGQEPLRPDSRYAIKHTTRTVRAVVAEIEHRVDVNTLAQERAEQLALNEIGRLRLRTSAPVMVDRYRRNRATGSFILIDESSNDTVGAGMVVRVSEPDRLDGSFRLAKEISEAV